MVKNDGIGRKMTGFKRPEKIVVLIAISKLSQPRMAKEIFLQDCRVPCATRGKVLFCDYSLREASRKDIHLCRINVLQYNALGRVPRNRNLSYLYT